MTPRATQEGNGQLKPAMLGVLPQMRGEFPFLWIVEQGWSSQCSQTTFGVTISGEWASSPNDCGYFLRGVGAESTNPQCPQWDDYQNYNDTMKAGILNYVLASMDATRDWFFWTWKVRKLS